MRDDLEIPPPGYRVARRAGGLDPATKRLATIAAGIGGALVVLVGIWSMVGGSGTGVPVVQAPPGPMRVKPVNPGGMKVAGTNERILTGAPATGQPTLAPPPETPDLQALQNPPAAPAANAVPAKAASTNAPNAPAIAANGLPLPPPAPPPVELAAASTAAPPPAAIGTGTATEVQLAAMSSENGAKQEWQKLQADLSGLLDGRQPLISKVEVAGHTFWRVRTGGFANVAEATRFCAAVRAKGKGCAIAAF